MFLKVKFHSCLRQEASKPNQKAAEVNRRSKVKDYKQIELLIESRTTTTLGLSVSKIARDQRLRLCYYQTKFLDLKKAIF